MNISIFKKYATTVASIEACKNGIEDVFIIVFQEHESSYLGCYFKAIFLNANLNLFKNYNEIEEDWMVPNFKQFPIILTVSISSEKKKTYCIRTRF